MAERRMFNKQIIDSDAFLDMPTSAQNLYFHLGMRADDDGFVNGPKKIMKICNASNDDMNILIARKFVIDFSENGVIVIKHWRIHNYIQKDRYKETNYKELKQELSLDENGAYTQHVYPKCIQGVSEVETQDRLGKDSKGKNTIRHKSGRYGNVLLTDEQFEKLRDEFPDDWSDLIQRVDDYVQSTGKHYKDYLATIRNWVKRDKERNVSKKVEAIPVYETKNQPSYDEEMFKKIMEKRNEN